MWIALVISLLALSLIAAFALFLPSFEFGLLKARRYRTSYLDLIASSERLVKDLNGKMTGIVALQEASAKEGVVERMERLTDNLERLMESFNRIPPFEGEWAILQNARAYVRAMERDLAGVPAGLGGPRADDAASSTGPHGDTAWDGSKLPARILLGCLFCSRPFYQGGLFKSQYKKRNVMVCTSCRDRIQNRQRLRVLFFEKNGRKLHWSETKEYDPTRDYREIMSPGNSAFSSLFRLIPGGEDRED